MNCNATIRCIILLSLVVLLSLGCGVQLSGNSLPQATPMMKKLPAQTYVITRDSSPTETSLLERAEIQETTDTPEPKATVESKPANINCAATFDDGISPSYKPGMPERTSVGKGHILRGTVRSSRDCAPIAGAMVEVWPEYEGLGHPDQARATLYTDENGSYAFESDLPEHIHLRVSVDGYRTIGNNSYHTDGKREGIFDIVLKPIEN